MNITARVLSSHPSSSKRPQKRSSVMVRALQQRNKFFQLDYLFHQPNINWLSNAHSSKKQHKTYANHSKTLEHISMQVSPRVERLRTKTIQTKQMQKNIEIFNLGSSIPLHIGDKGDTIHSKKGDSRIRTNSSLHENRISEVTLRNQLKMRLRERISQGDHSAKIAAKHNYPLFAVTAQGVSYAERATSSKGNRNKSGNSFEKRKNGLLERRKNQKDRHEKGYYRCRETKAYRPWSPVHREQPNHFGINDLLTEIQ